MIDGKISHIRLCPTSPICPKKPVEIDFAVDYSWFTANRYARWVEAKYGRAKVINKKDWIKVHIMRGVKTNIVTAVELSGPNAGDSPGFKPLMLATSNNFVTNEVSTDKTYSAQSYHEPAVHQTRTAW
jgi:hypothetical protein